MSESGRENRVSEGRTEALVGGAGVNRGQSGGDVSKGYVSVAPVTQPPSEGPIGPSGAASAAPAEPSAPEAQAPAG